MHPTRRFKQADSAQRRRRRGAEAVWRGCQAPGSEGNGLTLVPSQWIGSGPQHASSASGRLPKPLKPMAPRRAVPLCQRPLRPRKSLGLIRILASLKPRRSRPVAAVPAAPSLPRTARFRLPRLHRHQPTPLVIGGRLRVPSEPHSGSSRSGHRLSHVAVRLVLLLMCATLATNPAFVGPPSGAACRGALVHPEEGCEQRRHARGRRLVLVSLALRPGAEEGGKKR